MTTHTPLPANEIARRSPYKRRHSVYLHVQVQTEDDDKESVENEMNEIRCKCGKHFIKGNHYEIMGSKVSNYSLFWRGLLLGFFVDINDACEYMINHAKKHAIEPRKMSEYEKARESKDKKNGTS